MKNNYFVNWIKVLLVGIMFIASNSFVMAQCPSAVGSVTASVSSTDDTCGGNGSITVTYSNGGNISLVLMQGATTVTQYPTAVGSVSYTWNGRSAGSYIVRVVCKEDNSVVYHDV